MNYDEIDKNILKMIQKDLPLKEQPYKELAEYMHISEDQIVSRIKFLQEKGVIRRMGAVLRHQRAGYTVNAMVAWKVDSCDPDEVGKKMAEYKEISHCYLRDVPESFGYPLFSMIHAKTEEHLKEIINSICTKTGLDDYLVIKSRKELKKTSMEYLYD